MGGNWRGAGTAWQLAEAGHEVILVTHDPLIGKELQRSAADQPLRKRLSTFGVQFVVEAAIVEWLGGGSGADVVDLLTGNTTPILADDLVMSTTNKADETLPHALENAGISFVRLGD